jgi:hypothetical protein
MSQVISYDVTVKSEARRDVALNEFLKCFW